MTVATVATTPIKLGRWAAALGVVASVTGSVTAFAVAFTSDLGADYLLEEFLPQLAVIGVAFGLLSWTVLGRESHNKVVWLYVVVTSLSGIYCVAQAVAGIALRIDGIPLDATAIGLLSPRDLPFVGAVAVMIAGIVVSPAIFWLLSIGIVWFPDGRLPSRRWRWVVWLSVVSGLATSAVLGFLQQPFADRTLGAIETDYDAVVGLPLIGLMIATAVSFAGLIVRFRRSDGVVHQQLRWILYGTALVVPALGASVLFSDVANNAVLSLAVLPPLVFYLVCFWIALTRYRLYDIDVVISRTFVFGALAVFIGGVYVGLVVGVGALFGGGSDANPVLAIGATVVVAVAFQPLRARLQRVANRMVYGKRATPYEVLSEFSRQVAATDESLLGPVARSLVEGTAASGAAVWALHEGRLRRVSVWPEPVDGDGSPVVAVADPGGISIEGADVVLPVVEGGEMLGALALSTAPGQSLSKPDMELAQELASGVALTLRNIRLTGALEERVTELRDSRRRIVALQDETRRTLERDLHDGAQQRLVAMKVKLALAGQMAARDGATRTAEFLRDLSSQADQAVAELREFARGIYPPLLEAEGLEAALRSEAGRQPIVVDVATEGIGRYPKEIEATVYFCVLEALHNVARHSGASSAQVTLSDDGETLRFEVRDAGAGFDQGATPYRAGLQNVRDRLDATGGTITIHTTPGSGTLVRGALPRGQERGRA